MPARLPARATIPIDAGSMASPSLHRWLERALQGANQPPPHPAALGLLTVVIPSYARQDFLLRQCAYWYYSGAAVVMVDGSPDPLDADVQATISRFGNVTYLHLPESFADRLRLACAHITTPYTVLSGDDEFLLFDGLARAMDALQADPGLAACIGQSIAFHPDAQGHCTYGQGYPHWQYAVMQGNASARLESAMAHYTAATCYAVLRTPIWQRAWGQLKNWSSPYVSEMQQGMTTYIWGKLTTVDEVYWMRSSENRPVTNIDFNRGLTFSQWWASREYSAEHQDFVSLLASQLVSAEVIDHASAQSIVKTSIATLIRHLDEIEASALRALPPSRAVISKLRRGTRQLLKALLPKSWYDIVAAARPAKPYLRVVGEFGNLADLEPRSVALPFARTDSLFAELDAMQKLIDTFYFARKSQAQ